MDLKKFNSLYETSQNVGISAEKFESLYSSTPEATSKAVTPTAAPVNTSLPPQLTPIATDPVVRPSGNQVIRPPGMKSALGWTEPKPALPERPQLIDPNVIPQKTFKAGDIGESLQAGAEATLGRFYNLVALKEKATRENTRLTQSRSGLTDVYSNMWMSMLPTPCLLYTSPSPRD